MPVPAQNGETKLFLKAKLYSKLLIAFKMAYFCCFPKRKI